MAEQYYLSSPKPKNHMHVKLATSDNLPALMTLLQRVIPLMLADGNLQWDESYPNEAVFKNDIGLEQLWVAEIDGHIAGVAALTMEQEPEYADVGWNINEKAIIVHRLAVDPSFRRMGVAAALMQRAEDVATKRGITVLRADTNTQNQATRRLFPKLGYSLAGEIVLAIRPGLRFLCYEKRLAVHTDLTRQASVS